MVSAKGLWHLFWAPFLAKGLWHLLGQRSARSTEKAIKERTGKSLEQNLPSGVSSCEDYILTDNRLTLTDDDGDKTVCTRM